MNIHEYQAKKILKDYGAPVSEGAVILSKKEIKEKIKSLNGKEFVVKAQIHAGGRGKAGGVKLVKNLNALEKEIKEMFGKILITHQTGPEGKEVKRVYVEEASDIKKELYLSCLVDRESSKIAFISSTEGGMDIEKVAKDDPEKIITNKVDFENKIDQNSIKKILEPFKLTADQKAEGAAEAREGGDGCEVRRGEVPHHGLGRLRPEPGRGVQVRRVPSEAITHKRGGFIMLF